MNPVMIGDNWYSRYHDVNRIILTRHYIHMNIDSMSITEDNN